MLNKILIIAISIVLFSTVSIAQEKVWFAKAEKAFEKKNYEGAVEYLTKALEIRPDYRMALYYRGTAYLYLRKYDKSLKDFADLIELAPNFPDAYNSRGLCYSNMGEYKKAAKDFQRAASKDSTFAQAYLNLGDVYFSLREPKQAVEAFSKAIELSKAKPETYLRRGASYYLLDKHKEAAEDYTKAIEMGVNGAQVYYNRANAYFKLGEYKKAVEDYSEVIKRDSLDIEALNNRALAYKEIGLPEKAERDNFIANMIEIGVYDKTPVNRINFKEYKFFDAQISVKAPEDWTVFYDTTDYGAEMVVTKDSIHTFEERYAVGIKLTVDSAVSDRYEAVSAKEILNLWLESSKSNAKKSYKEYEELYQRKYEKADLKGFFTEKKILISENLYPIRLYEIVLVKDGFLFYAYFQSPEYFFDYYRKIFEKSIKSLETNY